MNYQQPDYSSLGQRMANQNAAPFYHDNLMKQFEQQQIAASQQYQWELAVKRQRDDEAFLKICKEINDFWNSPMGIACEIMQLVAVALPILIPAIIVLMMLNHA